MSPAPHTELPLEEEIEAELCRRGWEKGDWHNYDRERALYPEDVIGWLQDAHPKEYAKIRGMQNAATDRALLDRLARDIQDSSTIAVLRSGFKKTPVSFAMCQFKPDSGLNETTAALFAKVRCRVVRQLRYSTERTNSAIDMALFVNGIAVATIELKTEFTQTVGAAIEQYRNDRKPVNPKTGHRERLLTEITGAIIHFAVSDEEAYMTTKLDGENTVFLPFNRGNNCGKGNPYNAAGDKTAYLWEEVLARESFLDILNKFVYIEKKKKVEADGRTMYRERLIFPRYHQLDAVRKILADAKAKGPGQKYLAQHSAGSGKSNSITWLVHDLSNLHNEKDATVFDTVIVVTDRKVLDDNIRDAILQFDHKAGSIAVIDEKHGAKSEQLRVALANKTPIISVTIQTFPFVIKAVGDEPTWAKRTFAIVIDEAHSSQSGRAAQGLREALADDEEDEDAAASVLRAGMKKRAKSTNVSYFAFTATPKARTIELFGTPGDDGKPHAFHEYTMQQAIEEYFILDVLRNYTTYDVARRIATQDAQRAEDRVPKSKAARLLVQSARLHPSEVYQKVAIIVEHFREKVKPLLGGRAKAMIVTDSRPLAVQYKLETERYINESGADLNVLVAFSGTVIDEDRWPGKEWTESSFNDIRGASIAEAFDSDEYQILIAADKFQTGFDQPLLCAMYVDKRLHGIKAVQTLSRLNRTYTNGDIEKTQTFILDFVNKAEDILESFRPYYRTAELSSVTDPDKIHDIQRSLDQAGFYDSEDVDRFADEYVKTLSVRSVDGRRARLKTTLDPVVERYKAALRTARSSNDVHAEQQADLFRSNLAGFVRMYGFLSQLYDYEDTDIEKRYIFYGLLARLIREDENGEQFRIGSITPTHLKIAKRDIERALPLGSDQISFLNPSVEAGTAKTRDKQYEVLRELIATLNDIYGADLTDSDRVEQMQRFGDDLFKVAVETDSEQTALKAQNNSEAQFLEASAIPQTIKEMIVDATDQRRNYNDKEKQFYEELSSRLLKDPKKLEALAESLAKAVYRHYAADSA